MSFFCSTFVEKFKSFIMSKGQFAYAGPEVTGLLENVKGEIINVRKNPFIGDEIAIRDANGRIYFGAAKYFTAVAN